MPPDPQAVSLMLHIQGGEDTDADALDRLTRQLRTEIQELDVESVELVKREAIPSGAKSAEATALGALAVAILPEVLPKLIEFLHARLGRGDNKVRLKAQAGDRSLEVEYSPRTMSVAEVKSLVDTLTGTLMGEQSGSSATA
jgi:hypothetical protein